MPPRGHVGMYPFTELASTHTRTHTYAHIHACHVNIQQSPSSVSQRCQIWPIQETCPNLSAPHRVNAYCILRYTFTSPQPSHCYYVTTVTTIYSILHRQCSKYVSALSTFSPLCSLSTSAGYDSSVTSALS